MSQFGVPAWRSQCPGAHGQHKSRVEQSPVRPQQRRPALLRRFLNSPGDKTPGGEVNNKKGEFSSAMPPGSADKAAAAGAQREREALFALPVSR